MQAIRRLLSLLLVTLLASPASPALGAPFSTGGMSREEVQTLIEEALEREREKLADELEGKLAAQQAAFLTLLQQSLRPQEQRQAEVDRAEETLAHPFETPEGRRARELVEKIPVGEIETIEAGTPRQEVERLTRESLQQAEELEDLARQSRKALREALDQECGDNLLKREVPLSDWSAADLQRAAEALHPLAELTGRLRDDPREQVVEMTDEGRWTADLLGWLPADLLPDCARRDEVRHKARASSEVDAAAQAAQNMVSSALMTALSTGNPYVIAVVAVLVILAALFTGQGGGGGGGKNGGADGPDDGPGVESTGGEQGNGLGATAEARGTGRPSPNVEVDPDGEWEVRGPWPEFEIVWSQDPTVRCAIDFTRVEREDGRPFQPRQAEVVITAARCDPSGEGHSIVVKYRSPESGDLYRLDGSYTESAWRFAPGVIWTE